MEKKGKKALVLGAALLLVGGAGVFTYAKYTSSATATRTADVAKWAIEVNDTDIVTGTSFPIAAINWATNANVATNQIAPGSTGTFEIEIDASQTEVVSNYTVDLSGVSLPTGITVAPHSGTSNTGEIGIGGTANLVYDITWATNNDADDTTTGSTIETLSIPVEVTVSQKLN